jgi:large subunit ribosomal protein L31e
MAKTETKKDTHGKMEREYIIPLRKKSMIVPRYKKTNKAVKVVKEFLARHMKIRDRDLRKIKIDKYLNEALWAQGIRHPPHKIKVKAVKEPDKDIVRVELAEMPEKLKFKKKKREAEIKQAKEILESKKTMMQKLKETTAGKPEEKTEEPSSSSDDAKEKASAEATKQLEKAQAKKAKHEAKTAGQMKQPKRQQRKALAK